MESDRGGSNGSPSLVPQPSAIEGQRSLARAHAFGDQGGGGEPLPFSTVEAVVIASGEVCDAIWQQLDAFAPHAARARSFSNQDDGGERVPFSTVEAIVMESREVCDALWQQLDAFAPHAVVRPPSLPRELV